MSERLSRLCISLVIGLWCGVIARGQDDAVQIECLKTVAATFDIVSVRVENSDVSIFEDFRSWVASASSQQARRVRSFGSVFEYANQAGDEKNSFSLDLDFSDEQWNEYKTAMAAGQARIFSAREIQYAMVRNPDRDVARTLVDGIAQCMRGGDVSYLTVTPVDRAPGYVRLRLEFNPPPGVTAPCIVELHPI